MKARIAATAMLAIGLATTAEAGTRAPICEAMAQFANATPAGSTQFVEYTAGWGAEPTWSCDAGGSEPGRTFCAWLMRKAAKEFGMDNVKGVLSCATGSPPLHHVMVESLEGKVLLIEPRGVDRRVWITLDFNVDDGIHQRLRITASRDAPDDDPR